MKHKLQVFIDVIFRLASNFFLWLPFRKIRTYYLRLFVKSMGAYIYVGRNLDVRQPRNISLGDRVVLNKRALLDGRGGLTIEHDVDIAQEANIWTQQHDYNTNHKTTNKPVFIGHHSWICARGVVLPGVNVAPGTVLATCAILTKDTSEKSIMGGIPAHFITLRNNDLEYKLIHNPRFFD